MEILIEDLWKELEFDESLKEYVVGKVDKYIEKISEQVNQRIEARISSAINDISKELGSIKVFAKCADTKINKHLLSHCEVPE